MHRRVFLATSGAAFLAAPAIAAPASTRRFTILRDGSEVGFHTIDAVRKGDRYEVSIEIELVVRVIGIPAYRYELSNREVWAGQRLKSVQSRVNDDGEKAFSEVTAAGGALSVSGSGYSGTADPSAVTTSYLHADFLSRNPWISTQTGKPLSMRSSAIAGRPGWYRATGDYTVALGFTDAGEWVGCEFDAGGELASYRLDSPVGEIGRLWRAP